MCATYALPACCNPSNLLRPMAPISSTAAFLARTNLLIFDDWLRDPLSRSQAKDLLEILDDRYGRTATLVATQVPVSEWHARIPNPALTIRSSIIIHNAYRLNFSEILCEKSIPP